MKRALCLLLIFAILCATLSGCSGESGESTGESSSVAAPVTESSSSQADVSDSEESSSKMSDEELSDFISDKYFTADPKDYPVEYYGKQLDGDFGAAVKVLNADFKKSDTGQAVIALYQEGDDFFQVHYSPSDKAVEENDYQTIAAEFMSMAKLIILTRVDYPDIPVKDVVVVLGRSSAMVQSPDYNKYGLITAFSPSTDNKELEKALQIAYDVAFEDSDIYG